MHFQNSLASLAVFALSMAVLLGPAKPAAAQTQIFDSPDHLGSSSKRVEWLTAMGLGSPQHLVSFESGFTAGQNLDDVSGVLPMGLVIRAVDVGVGAFVQSSPSHFGFSNPVGTFALSHDETKVLALDFSASPVDYVAFRDIDHLGKTATITFAGGATQNFTLDSVAGDGDTAEFVGIYRNNQPKITRVQFAASGGVTWGLDDIEYGVLGAQAVPEPASLFLLLPALALLALSHRRLRRS